MIRRSVSSDDSDQVDINLSPMIDCVFILLIFFIVTTVFVEETGVEVNKPDAAASIPLEKNSILIAITGDGQVIYGGRDIGVQGVGPVVKRLTQQDDMPVIIQADEGANHGTFARVYGEAKLAGAKQINFSTLR
ncbi:biopolymer transporter ExbD [Rubellicoccus peritrichatus]|uniref:Biopolymer transporter ExbD n=1 Tax=Rubellicoccus peritrichatus TaxID=3080537 RepID=A0AAQ3QWI1_9BACT|nr:biopolymer transporter ExbD [Puniceicoccus sp. CR14]WOO42738.1 biopolymer transporter ExbD [Puniceicoccus sp. CR14]